MRLMIQTGAGGVTIEIGPRASWRWRLDIYGSNTWRWHYWYLPRMRPNVPVLWERGFTIARIGVMLGRARHA